MLESTTLPNGYVETRDYDPAGRPELVENIKGSSTLSSTGYTYDAVGNPTTILSEDERVDYSYNARDMLMLACYDQPTGCDTSGATTDRYYRYVYDSLGNRLEEHHAVDGFDATNTYTYNADDELLAKEGFSGEANYSYDANGNRIAGGGLQMSYNDADQLTTATQDDQSVTFGYDGDGNRLSLDDGAGGVIDYLWDTNHELPQMARETTGTGAPLRRYIHGLDLISTNTPGQGASYFHYDALGSVVDVTNADGDRQFEYRYEPFGDLRRDQQHDPGAAPNPIRFTGEYYDTFLDSYHLRPPVRQPQRPLHPNRPRRPQGHRPLHRLLRLRRQPTHHSHRPQRDDFVRLRVD